MSPSQGVEVGQQLVDLLLQREVNERVCFNID